MTEEEKRLHRCCFSGNRPEKLHESEADIRKWLEAQIDDAIAAGYTTFISGCAMGVDIWAGQIVLQKKAADPSLRLIAATPWPGFAAQWGSGWREQYNDLLKNADMVVPVCNYFHNGVFQMRNEWMVDHASRVIAYYNGAPGGTKNTIDYAVCKGIEVVTNNPSYEPGQKKERKSCSKAEKLSYPENMITDIGLEAVFGSDRYIPLTEDQLKGLKAARELLLPREQEALRMRYEEQETLQAVGDRFSVSRERARQIIAKALRKLRIPSRLVYIKDGYEAGELRRKIKCADSLKKNLRQHLEKHPQATEEDIVKFVFQGMLGVGHLVSSHQKNLEFIVREMDCIEADENEPLIEPLSSFWVRMNLRAAKAREMPPEEIETLVYVSAQYRPVSFTRQNVYNFCMKLDGIDRERMEKAAEKVLDGDWLPSHSEPYREAYHPAYRVVRNDYRKISKGIQVYDHQMQDMRRG